MNQTRHLSALLVLLGGLTLQGQAADQTPPVVPPGHLQVVDAAGKPQQVKTYRITGGVRPLAWLAAADKDKATAPLALTVRAERKFHFLAGVTTLVPLDRLRSVEFDAETELMTVRVATGGQEADDAVLVGTTAYKGINKLTIEAEVDRGAAGVAEVAFQGGTLRGSIRSVRFPAPRVEAFKPGRPAVVVTQDKEVKTTHKVSDLLPLYQFRAGQEKLLPLLLFRKTLRLDVAKLKRMAVSSDDRDDLAWQVTQKDGEESTLTLLPSGSFEGEVGTLVGLVGRVPAGYQLFPLRRVVEVHFDATDAPREEPKEKEPAEKKPVDREPAEKDPLR